MRKSLLVSAILLLSMGFVTGCSTGSSDNVIDETPSLLAPLEVPVNSMAVGYNDILVSSYYDATVVPYVEEYVFTINGDIDTIHFELGNSVKKGDLLAELNHESIDTQIESLEERIASKRQSVEKENNSYNIKIEELKLKKSQLLSGKLSSSNPTGEAAVIDCDIAIYKERISQNNDNLEEELTELEERLSKLNESLSAYFIYAPMDGEVVYVNTSEKPARGETIIAVADHNTKYIQTDISAEDSIYNAYDVYALYNGNKYDIMHVPTIYDTTCENLVSAKGKFANFIVSGSMDGFDYGDYVLICIDTTYVKNALSVPNTALFGDGSSTYVYLVSDDGVRTRRDIVTSITDSVNTIVIDGLEEGDIIYVPN